MRETRASAVKLTRPIRAPTAWSVRLERSLVLESARVSRCVGERRMAEGGIATRADCRSPCHDPASLWLRDDRVSESYSNTPGRDAGDHRVFNADGRRTPKFAALDSVFVGAHTVLCLLEEIKCPGALAAPIQPDAERRGFCRESGGRIARCAR